MVGTYYVDLTQYNWLYVWFIWWHSAMGAIAYKKCNNYIGVTDTEYACNIYNSLYKNVIFSSNLNVLTLKEMI